VPSRNCSQLSELRIDVNDPPTVSCRSTSSSMQPDPSARVHRAIERGVPFATQLKRQDLLRTIWSPCWDAHDPASARISPVASSRPVPCNGIDIPVTLNLREERRAVQSRSIGLPVARRNLLANGVCPEGFTVGARRHQSIPTRLEQIARLLRDLSMRGHVDEVVASRHRLHGQSKDGGMQSFVEALASSHSSPGSTVPLPHLAAGEQPHRNAASAMPEDQAR